jgi:hypothetical protein
MRAPISVELRGPGRAVDERDAVQQEARREGAEQEVLERGLGALRAAAVEARQHVHGERHDLDAEEDHHEVARGGEQHHARGREAAQHVGLGDGCPRARCPRCDRAMVPSAPRAPGRPPPRGRVHGDGRARPRREARNVDDAAASRELHRHRAHAHARWCGGRRAPRGATSIRTIAPTSSTPRAAAPAPAARASRGRGHLSALPRTRWGPSAPAPSPPAHAGACSRGSMRRSTGLRIHADPDDERSPSGAIRPPRAS